MKERRPTHLCRSWLFVPGGEEVMLQGAPSSGSDVLIQELEDFTTPQDRPRARKLASSVYEGWRQSSVVVAVRINPLDGDGREDLEAVMACAPDIVALPKVAEPEHVIALDDAVSAMEMRFGIEAGRTELLPNMELARGVMQTYAIAQASPRVRACLLASEDLAADLGAERGRDSFELAYCRQRFLMECVAAGVTAVDFPYTWRDAAGVAAEAQSARRLGFKAKSAVTAEHAGVINSVLTPSLEEVAAARRIIGEFEAARARGEARVEVDGSLVEVPIYANAVRLLQRADDLAGADI